MHINDFRKLKLFMNMTQSGADQEKLTAINNANAILEKSNTTWDRVLDRVIKVDVEIESAAEAGARTNDPAAVAARRAAHKKRVDDAFEAIEATDPRGTTWADFIADLKSQWDRNGRLSDAQLEAIYAGARKAEGRRA